MNLAIPISEVEAVDKRGAAAHEAGHLTIALSFGVRAAAQIDRHNGTDPEREKIWVGRVTFPTSARVPPEVGIAGNLGENLYGDGFFDFHTLWEGIDSDEETLSCTDKAIFCGPMPTLRRAMRTAAGRLKKHEAFFRWAVDDLVANECIPDGYAWDAFHRMKPRKLK